MRYLGYFDMFNTCISGLSPKTFNMFCNTLLLTAICYCTALSAKAVIYCLTKSAQFSLPPCPHGTLPFGNKCIQISKGENLWASPQGLFRCGKRIYWSRSQWSLAWLEACSSHFGSLGHRFYPPIQLEHICSCLSGLLLWALTALEEYSGLNHKRGMHTTCGKDGATRPSFCRHQYLEDYLHNFNRERKKERKLHYMENTDS